MKITLIRHGKTKGNLEHRYIGVTDEHLCDIGISELMSFKKNNVYPHSNCVYVSPLLRCVETANILYKHTTKHIVENLKEKDFGEFENKNYNDLKNNEIYLKWCDNKIAKDFPTGESVVLFKKRCVTAFLEIIELEKNKENTNITIVCHGGTIMSIMSHFSNKKDSFYEFKVTNGNGYTFNFNNNKLSNIKKLF